MPSLINVHPFDPLAPISSGIAAFSRALLTTPSHIWKPAAIGTGTTLRPSIPIGRWCTLLLKNTPVPYFAAIPSHLASSPRFLPLTARFTAALRQVPLPSPDAVFLLHRLEPILGLRRHRAPIFVVIHGDLARQRSMSSDNSWRFLAPLYELLERSLIKYVSGVFVVLRSGMNYFVQRYPKFSSKLHYLPSCYDDSLFNLGTGGTVEHEAAVPRTLPVNAATQLIVYCARFEQPKDPLLAFRLFEKLALKNPRLIFRMYGDGTLRRQLIAASARSLVRDRIAVLFPIPHDDLVAVLREAALVVLTSHFEGLPIITLEALACGTPVAATPVGDIPRLLSRPEYGVLLRSRNPDAMASSIEHYLASSRWSAASVSQGAKPYAASTVIPEYFHTMHKLLPPSPSPFRPASSG
jgi:glycosyltransferase involved in cell wall biosynthesis